jgi:pimeloyl-ACP methyl ester carboxylesterase
MAGRSSNKTMTNTVAGKNDMQRRNELITLSDGRRLGYAEYGDPYGHPIFFFHGQPGNRLFRYPDETLTTSLGARLITIDRPGYGLSDFQPKRRLLDWPQDVSEFADALGMDRFAVLGFSAGGPYALICAHKIPHRLTRVGIADSAPPMHLSEINAAAPGMLRTNYWLACHAPAALSLMFRMFWWFSRRNSDAFLKMALQQSCQADKDILAQPDIYTVFDEVWKENLRIDCWGYILDTEILMKEWGFRLSDIQMAVYLWQGEADVNIPTVWARYMAKELPNCRATFFPDEGHFALFPHWKEIFQGLILDR